MTPLGPRVQRFLIAVLAFATLQVQVVRTAQAQDEPPIYLGGNPIVRQDRATLLREELRERKREIRELAERARKAKKARGKKAEYVPGDEDRLPANLRAGNFALPFGITQATIAPSNTKANDKTGDGASAGQSEQSIAFLGQNGLCAWNDGQGFTTPPDVQGYGFTTNGGASWTDGGVPLKTGTILSWSSDPSVTVNEKTGDFYYCGLTTNTGTTNGVGVARGHFLGASFIWDAATMVASGPNSTQGFDKQWMAADSSNGNLYVTWTLFTATGSSIYFSRSMDNGASWSVPALINGAWENGWVSGSRPAVGPNSEVYITYSAIGPIDVDSIKVTRSTNAGLTFPPAIVGMTEYDNYYTGAPGFNRARAVTFPSIAVDRSFGPNRGRVYLTIQDCVNFYGDPLGGGTSKSEVENNGNWANATPFTINQTLRGAQASTADLDYWKFPAVQGQTYIFFVDSLRTTLMKYSMRLYCPNDTLSVSRLAFSGDASTNDPTNVHALIVWTAPTTNTYYIRMQPVASTGGYRIRTGVHTSVPSDRARDARDVMVASSANGVTGWSARILVNDDAARYDNWLPEIAVPCDGFAYTMWFDWRDTPASCFGGSNIYVSRSTNAGTTWAPNQMATTATTANWTQVLSNIAPNQGDYNGMYGGDVIGMAWADGRLGDADVFTARINTNFSLAGCPTNSTVTAGTAYNATVTVNNLNVMFANSYGYTLTINRNWPGFPAGGSTNAAAGGSGGIPISFVVPDSAAHNEVVHICLTVNCPGGACPQTCCWDLTILNPVTPALASLATVSAEPGAVRLSWFVEGVNGADIERSDDGSAWSVIGQGSANGEGYLDYTDTDVVAGSRYAYRLSFVVDGQRVRAAQTWVAVPTGLGFALQGARPNPASRGFAVMLSLTTSEAARLEIIDLAGRRVLTREVGQLGAGMHTLSLERETALFAPGVYHLRLTQGSRVAFGRVSIVR